MAPCGRAAWWPDGDTEKHLVLIIARRRQAPTGRTLTGTLPVSWHRGREDRLIRSPLPPNRTGGFPAYGFPVSSCLRRIDRNESGLRADYTGPLSQRSHSASDDFVVDAPGCSCDVEGAIAEGDCEPCRRDL